NGRWSFENVEFDNDYLSVPLDVGDRLYGTQIYTGTITIDGVVYGPKVTVNKTGVNAISITANDGGNRAVKMPVGIFESIRFRLTTVGSVDSFRDEMNGNYDSAILTPNT